MSSDPLQERPGPLQERLAPQRRSALTHAMVALAMAGAVALGVWVTGALITNDFKASMALGAIWFGVAGVAALLLARRWRRLRVAIVGSYLLSAVVIGGALAIGTFRERNADDQVVTGVALSSLPRASDGGAAARAGRERGDARVNRNVIVARGKFESLAHETSGTASVIRLPNGEQRLTLTGFATDPGPDLRVYVSSGAAGQGSAGNFKDLGALKGNKGDQQYVLARGIDLSRYRTVLIWCRAFTVGFGKAPLAPA